LDVGREDTRPGKMGPLREFGSPDIWGVLGPATIS